VLKEKGQKKFIYSNGVKRKGQKSTRGVPPFLTDEKTVNDYYPFGMTIAERSSNKN